MSSPQHEPTMEEILASIRKIISEDAPEAVPAAAAEAAAPPTEAAAKQELLTTPETAATPDIEVLELTQEIFEAPAPVAMAEAPKPEEKPDEVVFEPVLQKYLSDNSAAVIDGMKPLIREWMDENFPPLLENAVRSEIERVVKARGKR